jgi:cytochrome c oxidase accessory protein FixG
VSHPSAAKPPTLDTVTTINPDGSRYFLHPADVRGRFTAWRRVVGVLLLAIYVLLPWIPVNGHPAVFLDVANRRFHLFGVTFAAQDAWLLFFVITGTAFALFYVTALFGRIWCGWTCPYTVFLDHVYRRIERWIDGDAPARRKLEDAPWDFAKTTRFAVKQAAYLLVSALIAHVFLSYFVSIERLYGMMQLSPLDNLRAFGAILFVTAVLYFGFAWFREQFCIILCPYGRFQSVLTDEDTIVIGYDAKRGEPRGKASDPSAGHCINCRRCVQVCPTGIDIRNGLQLECIGCAACVDACDEVMTKLDRPKGLVRYDSAKGLRGETARWLRGRTLFYTALLLAGMVAFTVSILQVKPIRANLVRMEGPPFFLTETAVRNHFRLRLVSKRNVQTRYRLELVGAPEGATLAGADAFREIAPMGEDLVTVPLEVPRERYGGAFDFHVLVRAENGQEITRAKGGFAGPHPRLMPTAPPATAPAP